MKTSGTITFDGWTLRADIGELTKDGRKIRLQQRPLLVLEELLAHPGELVTREQLIARLWPRGVVDFDTGLNTAVRKLRVALEDTGDVPRYIETIPRKGYRFIGVIDSARSPSPATETPAPPPQQPTAPAVPRESVAVAAPGVAPSYPPDRRRPEHLPDRRKPATSPARWPRYLPLMVLFAVVGVILIALAAHRAEQASLNAVPASPAAAPTTLALLPLVASPASEEDSLVMIASDLLRQRAGRIGATVINAMTLPPGVSIKDRREGGPSLDAAYLLDGWLERRGAGVRLRLELTEARSGSRIWSAEEDAEVAELPRVIDKLVRAVASRLDVPAGTVTDTRASAPLNPEAYAIYLRAQELMENLRVADARTALELSRRATVLDPGFARAYVGLAQALILDLSLAGYNDEKVEEDVTRQAFAAIDRALELDPGLGEAVIERARLLDDTAEAERLYREGLRLAPNHGLGRQRYAEFLYDEDRRGEAIEEMDRAIVVEPFRARLRIRQAMFRLIAHGDAEAHDRLLREALEINPKQVLAMLQLAMSEYANAGRFADAIRRMEQAIALDPQSDEIKVAAVMMYLDVDDPDAAQALLALCEGTPRGLVELAMYRRDRRRAAEIAALVPIDMWRTTFNPFEAMALRDAAIASGDFTVALERIEQRFALAVPWGAPRNTTVPNEWNRALGIVLTHTLLASGRTMRGERMAQALLARFEGESVGRKTHFLSRDLAAAHMLLGDKERALEHLAHSMEVAQFYSWWYLGELDPLFAPLRSDPRFVALRERARAHRAAQRALVEEMRQRGEIPRR